jgi:hypothetical protein
VQAKPLFHQHHPLLLDVALEQFDEFEVRFQSGRWGRHREQQWLGQE